MDCRNRSLEEAERSFGVQVKREAAEVQWQSLIGKDPSQKIRVEYCFAFDKLSYGFLVAYNDFSERVADGQSSRLIT